MARDGKKGEATKERIVSVAAEVFALKGFSETKVSDIVTQAGVSQPAFYLYFKSKEQIFAELISRFENGLAALARNGLAFGQVSETEFAERVRGNMRAVLEYFAKDRRLTRIALYQSGEARAIRARIAAIMGEVLLVNRRAGHLRRDLDTTAAAEALTGMIDRLTETWILDGNKTVDETAAALADLFFYGILAGGR